MGSIVYCIHHKDGCKWSDELRKLKVRLFDLKRKLDILENGNESRRGEMYSTFAFYQAHLNTCKHDAVPCGNKCGAMIPRVLMEDHLKYTCAQRRARCDFCAKEFTGHTLEVYTRPMRELIKFKLHTTPQPELKMTKDNLVEK